MNPFKVAAILALLAPIIWLGTICFSWIWMRIFREGGVEMKGKWTEVFTRREKDIPSHMEVTDGRDHGQGWACTCGCNKRIPGRKHTDGPPRDDCQDGFIPTSGGASAAYRRGYDLIDWGNK